MDRASDTAHECLLPVCTEQPHQLLKKPSKQRECGNGINRRAAHGDKPKPDHCKSTTKAAGKLRCRRKSDLQSKMLRNKSLKCFLNWMYPKNSESCKSLWIAALLLDISSAGMCEGESRHGAEGEIQIRMLQSDTAPLPGG